MSFLDKPLSDMSLADIQRLIESEVARQVPAIPTGVLALNDQALPVTVSQFGTQGQVPTFHAPGTNFVFTNPGSLSDGAKPTTSPDLTAITSFVQGGIGLINVVWAAVTNGDPVGYDVHISSSNGFTPDATTLYGTTMATSMVIKAQANGSSLIYNTNYYVRIVAFDNDGAAAAGVQSAAVTISADIGTITAGTLIGATVETASSGQRAVMDSTGLHLYDSSNGVIVDLPSDSGRPAAFLGTVVAKQLTTLSAALEGTTYVAENVHLQGKVTDPTTAPSLSVTSGGSLSASTRYYVAYAWYSGSAETTISPVASILTDTTNKTIQVTVPFAPSEASQVRVYVSTVSFVTGAGHLQSTTAASTTLTTTIPVASYSSGGAASSAVNTTAGLAIGVIRPIGVAALASDGSYNGWSLEGTGRLAFLGPTIFNQWWNYTEFLMGANEPSGAFVVGGTTGVVANGTPALDQPGVVNLGTGSNAAGRAAFNWGTLAGAPVMIGNCRIRFSVAFAARSGVPNGTNNYQIALGLVSSNDDSTVGTAGNSAIAFTFAGTTNPGTALFGLRTTNASGTTFSQAKDASAVNVSLAVGVWHFAEFEVSMDASTINWWVDGVPQTAMTAGAANFPAGADALLPHVGITKTASTSVRGIDIDRMAIFGDYLG